VLTNEWETLAEVAARTGADPVKVVDAVKVLFRAGEASCRFMEAGGVKITEIRKKEA
jgi:hypothetical protein